MNYTKVYNPYAHLKQSVKPDGLPAYAPYEKNGVVQIGDNGRIILVPEVHLDANAYRDWFHTEFPNGRIELVRRTDSPAITPEGTLAYPMEIFEARLYTDQKDEIPKSNGFGKAQYMENGEFDEIGSAISKAIKNAMRNMGFGVDFDTEKILEGLPRYVELTTPGKLTEVAPVDARQLMQTNSLQGEQKQESVSSADASAPMHPATSSEIPQAHFAEKRTTEPAAEAPGTASAASPATEQYDVLAYLSEKAQVQAEEIPSNGPEMSSQVEKAKEESSEDHETPTVQNTTESTDAGEVDDQISRARAVIFKVKDPSKDPLVKYEGTTMGDLFDKNRNLINMITKPSFTKLGRLPDEVKEAAAILSQF